MPPPKPPLRAITLHRPWAYAITELGKRIENRTWACPLKPGEWLAIHAGKRWDKDAVAWIEKEFLQIIPPEGEHPTGIVAVCQFMENIQESNDPWFCGPYGWVVEEVVKIDPVRCPGQQRIWYPSDAITNNVRQQFSIKRESRKAGEARPLREA